MIYEAAPVGVKGYTHNFHLGKTTHSYILVNIWWAKDTYAEPEYHCILWLYLYKTSHKPEWNVTLSYWFCVRNSTTPRMRIIHTCSMNKMNKCRWIKLSLQVIKPVLETFYMLDTKLPLHYLWCTMMSIIIICLFVRVCWIARGHMSSE